MPLATHRASRFTGDSPEVYRIRAGLTQAQAASRAKVGIRSVARLERSGHVGMVTISRLAAAYGVAPGELFAALANVPKRGRGKRRGGS